MKDNDYCECQVGLITVNLNLPNRLGACNCTEILIVVLHEFAHREANIGSEEELCAQNTVNCFFMSFAHFLFRIFPFAYF